MVQARGGGAKDGEKEADSSEFSSALVVTVSSHDGGVQC